MRILVVDDYPINRQLLRAQMESEGYLVFDAENGVEALRILEHEPVDAIISDILMPTMDGYRFCHEVRKTERLRDVHFVFYTNTYLSPNDEKLALDLGADKYLRKPASAAVLLQVLRETTAVPVHHRRVTSLTEIDVLQEYSESLVRKLEDRNVELERTKEELQQEIAERRHAEDKTERLNRVYAVLSGINSLIVRVNTREELFKETCRLAVEHGRFRLAWVGWLDVDGVQIKSVAWTGAGTDSPAPASTSIDAAHSRQRSLIAVAIDSQQPAVCNDIQAEAPQLLDGAELVERGYRSAAVLPLTLDSKAVGSLALYSDTCDFFDAEEMRLLSELAGDISFALDHIAKAERIDFLAYYDVLTGIANRTLFHERLLQFVDATTRGDTRFAVVVADLERFDLISDCYGRHLGDRLLKLVAVRFVQSVGNPNEVARIGATQFAAVIPDARQESEVLRTVERWWQNCFNAPFSIEGVELNIAARAGIALFPDDGLDPDILLKNAEAALKRAKATAGAYLLYTQEMNQRIGEKLSLESKLRRALEQKEFVLHYQPKVELNTRRIVGIEALMRWQSPELGLVPPLNFIPLLEETGMIVEAGAWALRHACLDRSRWLEQHLQAPRIAVNVSPIQLLREDFVRTVAAIVEAAGAQAGIDIEITESSIMQDIDNNVEKLKALRALRIGIAIDDFGTGYSSLGYLAKLPVDMLKIDRSFIATMVDAPDAMTLVSTIISLAHSLRLGVVAEGVESEEQANILRLLRCDQMQGYLIHRPMAFDAMTAQLACSIEMPDAFLEPRS